MVSRMSNSPRDFRSARADFLSRFYYSIEVGHRVADDPEGLTFVRWMGQKGGEILVINSSELRAVQGHQKNDFVLRPINAPILLEKTGRGNKAKRADAQETLYAANQKFGLDPDIDCDTRAVCEVT